MQNTHYSYQKLVQFRRNMHQNPELGFQQVRTRESVVAFLIELGYDPATFKCMAKTGVVFDVAGTGPAKKMPRCVAFRADMDALSMEETNYHLPYRSTCKAAHMCGHDGHTTCLLGFAMKLKDNLHIIPSNRTVRFVFQPSEEGPNSGAAVMIDEGVLDGVDEIYGMHNWPTRKAGELWVKEGPVMAAISYFKVTVIGTMGHGSEPHKVKDAIKGAIRFYEQIHTYGEQLLKQVGPLFTFCIPVFKAGSRFNVFSDRAVLQGAIRVFDPKITPIFMAKIEEILERLKKEEGFQYDFWKKIRDQVNVNTAQEAEYVLKAAKKVFGEDKASAGQLPFRASQDFANYTKFRPGAFFFVSSAKTNDNPPMLHSDNFDFNEDVIDKASEMWMQLALDRLAEGDD